LACLLASAACTEVGTDPNAVVAIRFDGAAYPSIVLGDSLRDSLGTVKKVVATGLNYKNDPVEGAQFVFSSPDTVLQLSSDGNVFARATQPVTAPARVFATIGSLQSQPDSLYVVARADSMRPEKAVDTIPLTPLGGSTPNTVQFTLFGDTLAGTPKVLVPQWLVSFQVRHGQTYFSPRDTAFAYAFVATNTTPPRRLATFVDTTDATGKAERKVWVQPGVITAAEDTIFLIATARPRKAGLPAITKETMIVVRRQ
jgi:hypothetical protein